MLDINGTFIGQLLVLLVLLWFIYKVVVPMLATKIEERQQKIANGLAAAERGQKDLLSAEARVEELVKAARQRALAIEQQAQVRANETIDAAKQTAQNEAARLLEAAQAQVALDTQKARDALRSQVAALAVSGAEKIIGREIDAKAHTQLLDSLAANL
ncbi:MAG: F0F1 ATP synthase subunit B [Proteobacteria bacterium]|nr:F0F1 ATP synthase subunit B [Pseudomonadota bacterium]